MHARTRTPPYIDHLFSIKIDNLPYRSNMGDVERYFKKFGKVGDIYIPRDSRTHESRGFAFVRYYDERDAEDAISAMDGALMDGREIRVAMARNGRPANNPNNTQRQSGGSSRSHNRESSRDHYNRDRDRDDRGAYRGDRNTSSYGRDSFRDRRPSPRRHSPPRRHAHRSRSLDRSKKKSRSPVPSPRYHRRSPSKSPLRSQQEFRGSRSRSPSLSRHSFNNQF